MPNQSMENRLQANFTLQGDKYRIIRPLGQGGFGITYLADQAELGRQVAIKELFINGINDRSFDGRTVTVSNNANQIMFAHQKEKFKKEARRIASLNNEHVVKVFDVFEENGTCYFVMEYLKGIDLAKIMNGQPLPEEVVTDYLSQILDALRAIHDHHIWHLDIKPANIIVDETGKVKLIDFGASKQMDGNTSVTTSSSIAFTPGFAPSEQLQGAIEKFGPWTDFYALGATLYVLLNGKAPTSLTDIEENGMAAFSFTQQVSSKMQQLIVWMMQPARTKRPQSVNDVYAFLNTGRRQAEAQGFVTRLTQLFRVCGVLLLLAIWGVVLYFITAKNAPAWFCCILGGLASLLLVVGMLAVKDDFIDVFRYSPILGIRKMFIVIVTLVPTAIVGFFLFPIFDDSPVLFAGISRNFFISFCVFVVLWLISSVVSKWLFNDKDHSTFISNETDIQDLNNEEIGRWMK